MARGEAPSRSSGEERVAATSLITYCFNGSATCTVRTAAMSSLMSAAWATLHLLRAGRARAALDGRDFVIPDDMQALALPVLAHRLLPSAEAVVTQQPPERVMAAIVEHLPLPQLR